MTVNTPRYKDFFATLQYDALTAPLTSTDLAAYQERTGKKTKIGLSYTPAWVTVGLALGLIGLAVCAAMSGSTGVFSVLLILGIVGLVVAAVLAGMVVGLKNRLRLDTFARANHANYIDGVRNPTYPGMIFDEGRSRRIDGALQFNNGVEIGVYQYTTGSGKNSQTHYWTYVRVTLPRRLPHMVLDSRKNNFLGRFSNLPDTFKRDQTLSLEGDFNEHFTLYAPKEYETDALYIFTPDVMQAIIEKGGKYDMEVIDDSLFIYSQQRASLTKEQTLRELLSVTGHISVEVHEQGDYYADERVDDRQKNVIANGGKRLKHGVNYVVIAAIVLYIIFQFVEGWIWGIVPGG